MTRPEIHDLRECPTLFATVTRFLPELRRESQNLLRIGAKRTSERATKGIPADTLAKYDIWVRFNRYVGEINQDIIPRAISFYDSIHGQSFEPLGRMSGHGLLYLGMAPQSSLALHRDRPAGTHTHNRVLIPLDLSEPERSEFQFAGENGLVTLSFEDHPFGFSFNPSVQHGAKNYSTRTRTVLMFELTIES